MRKLKLRVQRIPVTKEHWEARAHIVLGWHSRDKDGDTLLSPDCRTTTEVCTWADALIKELQSIKRQAVSVRWDNHPSRRRRAE